MTCQSVVAAGSRITCTADRAGVGSIALTVLFTDAAGGFTFQAVPSVG